MINKKCQSAPHCETIIRYMFGAKLKDAHKRPDIEFIGGNITSGSPFGGINSQNIRNVDTRAIEAEFNAKMSLYTGTGTQLVSHYVLSLPHQDKLSDNELNRLANGFLKEMGTNSSSTWVAARHNDTDCLHIHIAVCRVQLDYDSYRHEKHYGLLSDKNDYERGMEVCRKLEKEFDLTPTASPGEDVNHKNQASIIRAISKKVLSQSLETVSDFIHKMANEGVEMRPELAKNGKIRGLSYRLNSEDGRWISGSTVMSTKLTFGALTKHLNYLPSRDDPTLGLGPSPTPPICAPFRRAARIKKVGLVTPIARMSESIRILAQQNPYIFIIRQKRQLYLGLRFDCKFYPLTPAKPENQQFLAWELLVTQMTRAIMKMMKNSFKSTSFEPTVWPADCEVISGSAGITLIFDKLSEDNLQSKLTNTASELNSKEMKELAYKVDAHSRNSNGRQPSASKTPTFK
ncbi:relaxase/mobilization nuclease domain-containing protein [Pseudomonas sp. SbB1]|uniref:Relaxase/mobilization nuclease family protein n=2 Tax=Pseudomonas putida TaxID=303 RepID=B0KSW6_PSEPG|nr:MULTISPECIES: relaxase/mobilization nuclease domain-containing protein [Pseudomonas]ABZ00053.1 Relaxase/mobilization nuclease family protein [Pseudomonas putida GB-1]MBP0707866.1 relaxase/mobilization nuclease domain-containing protein [Pseudomonas sp. T34]MCK2187306.1 relaxase/mobilization nuclease domain-containing protein [Pseudomonas sp. MB04B]MDD2095154.1 relaxase/mobilization nuclease domain-containing protein [Pseudomonas putida]NOG89982.1 relaxase/mobilization nuclease domain-contai